MTTTVVTQNPTQLLGNQSRVRIHPEHAPPQGNRIEQNQEGATTHLGDALRTRITVSQGTGVDPLKTRVQLEGEAQASLVRTQGVMIEAPRVRTVRDATLVAQDIQPLSHEQIIAELSIRRKLASDKAKNLATEIGAIDQAMRFANAEHAKATAPAKEASAAPSAKRGDTEPAKDSEPEIIVRRLPSEPSTVTAAPAEVAPAPHRESAPAPRESRPRGKKGR